MISTSRYKYLLACVDACTKHTCIYPFKFKFDVLLTFTHFTTVVEVQFSTRIKARAVQIDVGGEFQALTSLLPTKSTALRLACPHTSPEWLSKAQAQACD